MRQIQIYENADILCEELAEALPIPASISEPIHIALSGGSTPTLLFEKMTAVDDPDAFMNTHFYWVDERHVPEDDPESNYAVFRRLMVDTGIVSAEKVHPIKYHPDIHQMKANYEQELRKHVPFEDGYPLFDEIVLGVGEDGHTASIFPDRLDLFETTDIVATTRHPDRQHDQQRLRGDGALHRGEEAPHPRRSASGEQARVSHFARQAETVRVSHFQARSRGLALRRVAGRPPIV